MTVRVAAVFIPVTFLQHGYIHWLSKKYALILFLLLSDKTSYFKILQFLFLFSSKLIHWGRDKMAAISQTTYSNAYPWMKIVNFEKNKKQNNNTEICSLGSNWQYGSIGSYNGLAPNRRQAIIWTNVSMLYWRINASLGLNELRW